MVVPAYAMDSTHTVVYNGNAGTFSAFGGGPAGLNTETDYFILEEDGTPSCQSKNAWAGALRGMMHDEVGTDLAVGTDGALLIWTIYHVPNALTARSASAEQGLSIRVGTSTTVNWYFTVGGGAELLFETWVPWVVQWDNLTGSTFQGTNGSPSAGGTVDWVGASYDVSSSGPTKGSPAGIDGIQYGRQSLEYTNGEAADYARFDDAEATANAVGNRWGVLEFRSGVYFMQGFHSLGVSGTAVDFRDQDKVIFIRDTEFCTAAFNRIEVINASSNVDWTNILITALGTQSPGTFVHTAGTFDALACQFTDMGTFTFIAASNATNCIFTRCDQITAPGSDLTGSQVLGSIVAANDSAVVWDVNDDPDGELDGMTFEMGANDSHAIEYGTNTPLTTTLRDITFTGYSGSNDLNNSVLDIQDTGSDVTWTINAVGVSGTVSFRQRRPGDTVNIVVDPVTLTITATDITDQSAISGARVLVLVDSAAGGWPYQDSVTITSSSTTATVAHTGHGMSTNDWVQIKGAANDEDYNGVFQITVTTVNEYTYTMQGTAASPATGTIVATFAVIQGTTNGSGVITGLFSYSADQPIAGRVRHSTTPGSLYKSSPITGTIDSANGLSIAVQMIPDE